MTKENISDFERIAALYRGDYLDGKDYPWCVAARARMQKYYADMVKQVASHYLDAEEYKKAEQLLLRNIEFLPYDEDAYEMLLRICFLQQDRILMMKHYGHLVILLQTELGIEPRPSLKRLYENLMNDF